MANDQAPDFCDGNLNDSVTNITNVPESGSWKFPLLELIEKNLLNCENCGSFFTTDGVFAVSNLGTVCANCVKQYGWEGERLKFFDAALQTLPVVPCPNAKAGCELQVPREDLNLHLEHCVYRPVQCIHPTCSWENKLNGLVEHFKTTHVEDVIDQESVFSLDVGKEAFVVAKLLIKPSDKYFLLIRRELNSDVILYNMYRVPKGNNIHDGLVRHFCDDIQDHRLDYRKQIKTEPLNQIDKLCALNKATLTVLKEILGGEEKWSLTVDDTDSKEEKLLICSGCRTTMTRPIYQCETQHSICDICSTILLECPVCQKNLGNKTRNFSLEALTTKIFRPCTYQKAGCEKQISLYMLKQHEATCLGGLLLCPLPNCSFEKIDCMDSFDRHVLQSHGDTLLPTNKYCLKATEIKTGVQYMYLKDGFFEIRTEVRRVANRREVSFSVTLLENRSYDLFFVKNKGGTRFLCNIDIFTANKNQRNLRKYFLITKDSRGFDWLDHKIADDLSRINVEINEIEDWIHI